jgi:gliding motility-associated-like protein
MLKKVFFVLLFILKLSSFQSFSITYTVINAANAGIGSLSQAITNANGSLGLDTITFSGPFSIVLTSALPTITDPVFINGIVTAGPQIEINGATNSIAGPGLLIAGSAPGSTIRGLNIHGFSGQGILLAAGNTTIIGCYIGTNLTGNVASANSLSGIELAGGLNAVKIGGSTPDSSNVISGNGNLGINIAPACTNIKISGNKIGVSANGLLALSNAQSGINATNVSNLIIGGGLNEGNIVSGNGQMGLLINGSTKVLISGNYIGANASGIISMGNGQSGMQLNSSSAQIGGTTVDSANIIVANLQIGIDLISVTNTVIIGNFIGVGANGNTVLGNVVHGVQLTGCSNIAIGGGTTGRKNVISSNGAHGIIIDNSSNITVQGNFIGTDKTGTIKRGNTSHGIQLQGNESGIIIGGRRYIEGNILSCNGGSGINFEDLGTGKVNANGTIIKGNLIGTDSTAKLNFGNNVIGIILKSDNCIIGSVNPLEGNVIGGTTIFCGLLIANGSNNSVKGNYIGVSTDGVTAIPNTGDGIIISVEVAGLSAINNSVEYNTIAYNGRYGINVGKALNSFVDNSETGNTLRFNSIYCNASLGIFLNLTNNLDWGNNGQKAPSINFFLSTANVIMGVTDPTLAGKKIDLYQVIDCPSCDLNPQGKIWIDSTTVSGTGSWSYNYFAKFGVPIPGQIVVTVTDNSNNTSQFSVCCTALSGASITPSANPVCPGSTFNITYKNGQKGDSLMLQMTLDTLLGNWINVQAAALADPITFSSITITDTTFFRFITYSQGTFANPACKDSSFSIQLNVVIAPVAGTASISQDTICNGQSTSLLLTGYKGAIQWQKSTNGGGFSAITGANTSGFTDSPTSTDSPVQYMASVSNPPCPGVSSNIVQVVIPTISSGIISGPSKICNADPTTLDLNGSSGIIQWQDSLVNGTWKTIAGQTSASISYQPSSVISKDYIRTIVKDPSGKCTAVSPVYTVISDSCTFALPIEVPNALTPNGDGSNDVFYIHNIWLYPNNNLTIYNRWGSLVFEGNGYNNEWDGTRKGEKLPVATYYYVLVLGEDINGNSNSKNKYTGSVTIIR